MATANIINARIKGDITVDSGGTLHCLVLEHSTGALINNGTINGIIGGQYFGTYQQKTCRGARTFR